MTDLVGGSTRGQEMVRRKVVGFVLRVDRVLYFMGEKDGSIPIILEHPPAHPAFFIYRERRQVTL